MGMYTELVLGVELKADPNVIGILKVMLGYLDEFDGNYSHPLFSTPRWRIMLGCGSAYFDRQADSKLVEDYRCCYLNVGCNFKNYNNEIDLFLDWLRPYIESDGFIGYMRYEENDNPTLIYMINGDVTYMCVERGVV